MVANPKMGDAAPPTLSMQEPERSQMLDDLIMGTNSSSITSKRSVERFYYPNETHYFRYFVKKFQRRAPLINRGYWLRLRAIDVMIRQFLEKETGHKKVIINLGCGSDVLPWQSHTRYPNICKDALFIDVDYPDLMQNKCQIVLETPELKEILGQDFQTFPNEKYGLLLSSAKYCQVGCDLREPESLRKVLETLISLPTSDIIFVAEVSITYMDTTSADNLIKWAATLDNSTFCLLEQIVPLGPQHPFAKTMLKHFNKLRTPPRSVLQYQTLNSQHDRFRNRGWTSIDRWDLWQAWSDDTFVSETERVALDEVEPFDEWEEFILFARHYFILRASNNSSEAIQEPEITSETTESILSHTHEAKLSRECDGPNRRFGQSIVTKDVMGRRHLVNILGLGAKARSDAYDVYSLDDNKIMPSIPVTGPVPRMCHTITDLGQYGWLLVGGRTSPANALSDCWVLNSGHNLKWDPVESLPMPLFRHSALRLRGSSMVLLAGGKTGSSKINDNFLVFSPGRGWLKCTIQGDRPIPLFGALLYNSHRNASPSGTFTGMLSGGIGSDGLLATKQYFWTLVVTSETAIISFQEIDRKERHHSMVSLFGASVVEVSNTSMICGGVGFDESIQGQSIMAIEVSEKDYKVDVLDLRRSSDIDIPFMIGASVVADGNQIFIAGGGATCFSMGTFWEEGVFVIEPSEISGQETDIKMEQKQSSVVAFLGSPRVVGTAWTPSDHGGAKVAEDGQTGIQVVPRHTLQSSKDFEEILETKMPVIIEGLDIGACKDVWTAQTLVEKVGPEKQVVVHECQSESSKMDFNSKNFRYVTDSFATVMTKIQAGGRLYLRSLSQEKPAEQPAMLEEDFPTLAKDFRIPLELNYVEEHIFSSILRISGRVNMWLHYDVMANVYAQIIGSKRMILFPPSDVSQLAYAPGSSSSSLDVFSLLEQSLLNGTRPFEAVLNPGDILLLPAMWHHTATPLTDTSVAVNVFFRDMLSGYAQGRDVYGNRDLVAYEKGRSDIAKLRKAFQGLPSEIRRFYLARLADELVALEEI